MSKCKVLPDDVPRLIVSARESVSLLKNAANTQASSVKGLLRRSCLLELDGFTNEDDDDSPSPDHTDVFDMGETPRISANRVRKSSSSSCISRQTTPRGSPSDIHATHGKVEHTQRNQSRPGIVVLSVGEAIPDVVSPVTRAPSPRSDDGKTLRLPVASKVKHNLRASFKDTVS